MSGNKSRDNATRNVGAKRLDRKRMAGALRLNRKWLLESDVRKYEKMESGGWTGGGHESLIRRGFWN